MEPEFEIVNIDQKDKWNYYLNNSSDYDFYHTWDYHNMSTDGEPYLFVFSIDENFIALPFLKRPIPDSQYYDCTSVYGYAGPVTNFSEGSIPEKVVNNFKDHLNEYLMGQNVISFFSRFHPIINKNEIWNILGNLESHGRTVSIGLMQNIDEQRKEYQRTVRAKVKQLKNKGFYIREATTEKDLDEFVAIYIENMQKVNASALYYFDKQYFKDMLNSSDYKTRLIICYCGDEITSGTIVTFSNKIIQFHLAATKNSYLKDGPMKLLIDEVTLMGRDFEMEVLHLGGGVGGSEDNLFKFKAGFSDSFNDFKTWRLITNVSAYDELVKERISGNSLGSNYFPLYRLEI